MEPLKFNFIQNKKIVPLLVEAIKDQHEQINTLKEEIKSIKNKEQKQWHYKARTANTSDPANPVWPTKPS